MAVRTHVSYTTIDTEYENDVPIHAYSSDDRKPHGQSGERVQDYLAKGRKIGKKINSGELANVCGARRVRTKITVETIVFSD